MKLHVDFDNDLIRKYVKRGSSPLFTIYWTQDGVAYPEDQWLDFGSVVLCWWLVAAKSLFEDAAKADLRFMEGPYSLDVRRFDNRLHISAHDASLQWQISTEDFIAELLNAADQVQRKFAAFGITDSEGLTIGAQQLKSAAIQAKIKAKSNRTAVVELVS